MKRIINLQLFFLIVIVYYTLNAQQVVLQPPVQQATQPVYVPPVQTTIASLLPPSLPPASGAVTPQAVMPAPTQAPVSGAFPVMSSVQPSAPVTIEAIVPRVLGASETFMPKIAKKKKEAAVLHAQLKKKEPTVSHKEFSPYGREDIDPMNIV